MKKLLQKLSRIDHAQWRQEVERQAAEEIQSVGSRRPAEASSAAWAPPADAPPAPDAIRPQPEHPVADDHGATVPQRRLTAQQRVAARQHSA